MKIQIEEQGEWLLVDILSYRLIEQTKYGPQFVFDLELQDGRIHPWWIPCKISARSKKFTFLTAATGDMLLKNGDKIDPEALLRKKVIGLWGRERGPRPKDTFLRFVPYPEIEFKAATMSNTVSDTAHCSSQKNKLEEFM